MDLRSCVLARRKKGESKLLDKTINFINESRKQILLVPYSHTAINDTIGKKLEVDRTCQELAQNVVQSKSTLPGCFYGPRNDIPSLWIQWGIVAGIQNG